MPNHRATEARVVMNSVYDALVELHAGLTPNSGAYRDVGLILGALAAGIKRDDQHIAREAFNIQPAQGTAGGQRINARDVFVVLQNQGRVSVQDELHALRRMADIHHQRLLRIEDRLDIPGE